MTNRHHELAAMLRTLLLSRMAATFEEVAVRAVREGRSHEALAFSDWNRIFKDPMTTMAVIDRVVHHSVILDMMGLDSYRAKEAHAQQTQAIGRSAAASSPAVTNKSN